MKINKNKIKTEYLNILEAYRRDIKTLDAEDRSMGIECAQIYYKYLAASGISYATLALDVIENKGKFGQLANIHLKYQSIFEGIKPEEVVEVREKIIIRLAYKDAKMRSQSKYNQDKDYFEKIEKYHEQIFKSHTSPYAWGGLVSKELIGSGSWMKFYEQDKGIFDGIEEIIKSGKIGKSPEYSTERMLQSVAHSYRAFSFGIDKVFELQMSAASKEQAALIWKIDPARIIEIKEEITMSDSSLVKSKVFKVLAADHFVPTRDPDYSSSDSDSEDDSPQTLGVNKVINQQMSRLLSNPSILKNYQQESLIDTLNDLKLAEHIVPNITNASLESMSENYEFLQQLIGVKDPTSELKKIKKLEKEEEKIESYLKNLMPSFQEQQTFTATTKTKSESQAQKVDYEDNDLLNNLFSNTTSMLNNLDSDLELQDFVKSLGRNTQLNYEDHI